MRGVGISLAEKPQKGSARGCREGFSGCSTRPWRDMPPAGWNGFPSGCQGNLWSTPPPLQLRRPPCGCTALELNSQRAHKRTGNRITRIVTRMEKFSDVCEFTDRAHATHTRPANPGPRTVANGHAEFAIQRSSPHSPFFCTALDDDERTSVGRVSHCFLSSVRIS